MTLILTMIDLEKWECGCWQIVDHSVIHLCEAHQNDAGDGSYWRTHPTVRAQGRLLEKESSGAGGPAA